MSELSLVTGGFGFIGNELVRQLSKTTDVVILDNRTRVATKIEDIANVPVYDVDITDQQAIADVIRKLKPSAVFHLAAIHYIPECNANPERTIHTNVEATLSLLRACSGSGVKHFLFASSGAVYTDAPHPLSESAPTLPVDIYGWSKLHAEQLCAWHSIVEGLPVTICRVFNNYGPRETNAHIIPEIISQLRQGSTLHLGNITARRDYIHVSDTARALRMLSACVPVAGESRVVNISSGQHATVGELIRMISGILDWQIEIVRDERRFRRADKQVQIADVALLQALAAWTRSIELKDGLRNLLEFEGFLPARDSSRLGKVSQVSGAGSLHR